MVNALAFGTVPTGTQLPGAALLAGTVVALGLGGARGWTGVWIDRPRRAEMGVTEEVLARVEDSREDLAELALRLGNTYSPWGSERILAEEVVDWYREHDLRRRADGITPRARTPSRGCAGTGGGRTLVFNAHLDTEASGEEYDRLMAVPDPTWSAAGARATGCSGTRSSTTAAR